MVFIYIGLPCGGPSSQPAWVLSPVEWMLSGGSDVDTDVKRMVTARSDTDHYLQFSRAVSGWFKGASKTEERESLADDTHKTMLAAQDPSNLVSCQGSAQGLRCSIGRSKAKVGNL